MNAVSKIDRQDPAHLQAGGDAEIDISVILPAHNEEEAIGDDLDDIIEIMRQSERNYEIMVVDDGSTDRTAEIVRARPEVVLVQHPFNRGTGAARTSGIRAARGEIIVFTDADRTYPNKRIPDLLKIMDDGADMVIGARQKEAGTMKILRTPAKWLIRRLAEFMTGSRIPDLNSGLRAQRRSETLRFLPILPTTHSWVSTITISFLSAGYRVEWTPIDYYPRVGKSTFHPIRDSYNYLSLAVRTVMYFNPLKIFLPIALAIIGLSFVKYLTMDIMQAGGFTWPIPPIRGLTQTGLFIGFQTLVIGLLADLIVKRTQL